MKRVLATMLATVLTATALVGCGSSSEAGLNNADFEKYVTKLGEYKGMQLSGSLPEITDEQVQAYVDYMMESSKELVAITENRPVQTGDVVNIDYVGKKDGVAFDGGTAQGYDLTIGSGTFIDGFEDGLIGTNVGDTLDLNLTFPENYGAVDLAGEEVVFTVTVNAISEQVKPELTDEYVQGLGMENCQNVEQFYEFVKASLEENAAYSLESTLQTQVLDNLLVVCEFSEDIPEEKINYYKDQINTNFVNSASAVGMEVADYVLQYYGMTEEQYETELTTGALNSAKQAMACAMIAKNEGLEVTDDDLKAKVDENYVSFGYESADAFLESGKAEDYREYLLTMKVLDYLIDNAVITDESAATEGSTETVETETAAE